MTFETFKENFNNTFNTRPKKIVISCVGVALVVACVMGGVMGTRSSDTSSTNNKEAAVEIKKDESTPKATVTPVSSADADLLKAEKAVSEAQTAYNTAKTAYNKDKTSTSAKQEVSEKGNALLSAKKKLLSLTTDSNDKEKLQNDISTLSTEIETYKDVAMATPDATAKAASKPEVKKETSKKKDSTSKSGQGTAPKKETAGNTSKKSDGSGKAAGGTPKKSNNSDNTKKACKTVHHPAKTHTVNHPAVTHQEPVYTTKQVQTGTRTVVDQQAYDETVYVGDIITCNNCGAKFNNYEAYKTHAIEVEGGTGGYHVDPNYQTVHHDAVTHQEPVYTTQQVQTGTRTVTDKQAWTETVTDKAAYTTCE